MPGRVSTRTSTASRITRKSSVPTLGSRASTAIVAPEEGPATALRGSICAIFADAQKTTAGHRKHIVNLRKIQAACCYEPTSMGKKGLGEFDEEDFNNETTRCVVRVLVVKKTEGAGDRIVRFLGHFLKHSSEKGKSTRGNQPVGCAEHAQISNSYRRNSSRRLKLFRRPQVAVLPPTYYQCSSLCSSQRKRRSDTDRRK
jgi:hypothetical protein